MTKESFKKFVKENKELIVSGALIVASATVLAVVGVKLSRTMPDPISESHAKAIEEIDNLLHACQIAGEGCSHYATVTLSDINATVENDCAIERLCRLMSPSGHVLDVKNLIAFGNEVEP